MKTNNGSSDIFNRSSEKSCAAPMPLLDIPAEKPLMRYVSPVDILKRALKTMTR